MAKRFTKEQTELFNKLFDTSFTWGDGVTCTGLFQDFGGETPYLATCFNEGVLEILEFNGVYWSLYGHIQYTSRAHAKRVLMKVVKHLMVGDFNTIGDL